MSKDILLSICIPTYNRALILKDSLNSIVNDSAFCEEVEIIISDNCSSDNTTDIVLEFTRNFKNIHYFRNATNIKDLNFPKVLSYGSGEYLKLLNDTVRFKQGMLGYMLDILKQSSDKSHNILFSGGYYKTEVLCSNGCDILNSMSFFITWLGNFGVWKVQWEQLAEKEKYCSLNLAQVDWLIRLTKQFGTKIFYNDYFCNVIEDEKKGGYNFFHIFIDNFLYLSIKLTKNEFNFWAIEKLKYSLYRHFLLSKIFSLLIEKKLGHTYELNSSWKIIFKTYKYYPYFYFSFILLYWRKFIK